MDQIFEEHAAEAYDENVDYFMELANEQADREHKELIAEAEKSHKLLRKAVKVVIEKTAAALKQLEEWEKTKWGVDNT